MKKAFALLLTAVMLCGMFMTVPLSAYAIDGAVINPITAPTGYPPTCTEPGLGYKEDVTAVGSLYEEYTIPPLGHDMHSNGVVVKKATCTEGGVEQYTCSRCGYTENKSTPALGHNWGEWVHNSDATCLEKGTETRTCKRCGIEESRTAAPLGHEFGPWYIYKPAKYGSPETVLRRDCIRGDVYEEKTIKNSIVIELISQTATEVSAVGDAVYATYRVTNTSDLAVNVSGYNTDNIHGSYMPQDIIVTWPDDFIYLPSGGSADFQIRHVLAESDFSDGKLMRFVSVSGSPEIPDGASKYTFDGYVYSNTVEMDASFVPPKAKDHSIMLELVSQDVPEGLDFGMTVVGHYRVTNIGSANININSFSSNDSGFNYCPGDSLNGSCPDEFLCLQPDESAMFSLNHVVTEDDINMLQLVRFVNVGYSPFVTKPDGKEMTEGTYFSDMVMLTADIEGGHGFIDEPEDEPYIFVYKELLSPIPSRGFFVPSDNVVYKATVYNNTDGILENVELTDIMTNGYSKDENTLPSVSVDPYKSTSVIFGETLSSMQCATGQFKDIVVATIGTEEYTSNIVTIPTGYAKQDISITKTETSHPADGPYYKEGEFIIYDITVSNNGETVFKNGFIVDILAPDGGIIKDVPTLKPNESVTVSFQYQVTEYDVGMVNNVAFYGGYDPSGEYNEFWAYCSSPVAPYVPTVSVVKYETSFYGNGMYYVEGEQVDYYIEVTNTDPSVTIENVELYDAHYTDSYLTSAASLTPGNSLGSSFGYNVTSTDAGLGFVNNNAYVTYTVDGNPYIAFSNTVTVKAGIPPEGLTIVKAIETGPKNGKYYTPGETPVFRLTVYNNSMFDCTDVQVIDPLPGLAAIPPIGKLAAHDSTYIDVACDLTKLAINSSYSNAAVVTFENKDGIYGSNISNTVEFEYREENSWPELTVFKEEISTPPGGKFFYEGSDPVEYKITVTNTGDVMFAGGELLDILAPGDGVIGTIGPLKPSESQSFTFTYTGGDYGMGFICNQAAADVEDTNGNPYFFVSNIVTTNYGKMPPGDGEYPGEGDDLIAGDPDEDLCYLSMIACKDGNMAYSVTNCTEHTKIDKALREAVYSAKNKKQLLEAYTKGIEAWKEAVDDLYDSMLRATFGPKSRMSLIADRRLFILQVEEKQALLENQYPDDPEVTAELICNMYREKCSDLCWLYHSERGTTSDFASHEEAPTKYDECRMDLTREENGYLLYCLNFCEDHIDAAAQTTEAIRRALDNSDKKTAERWELLRGLWTTLLDTATINHYEAADANDKLLLMTDLSTFKVYYKNHEEFLKRFDPNQRFVDESLTRDLLLRTMQLCGDTEEHVYIAKDSALIILPDGTEAGPGGTTNPVSSLFGSGNLKKKKSGMNTWLIAGIGAAAAAVIAAVTVLLVKSGKKKKAAIAAYLAANPIPAAPAAPAAPAVPVQETPSVEPPAPAAEPSAPAEPETAAEPEAPADNGTATE